MKLFDRKDKGRDEDVSKISDTKFFDILELRSEDDGRQGSTHCENDFYPGWIYRGCLSYQTERHLGIEVVLGEIFESESRETMDAKSYRAI